VDIKIYCVDANLNFTSYPHQFTKYSHAYFNIFSDKNYLFNIRE